MTNVTVGGRKEVWTPKGFRKTFEAPFLAHTSPETSGFYGSLWILMECHQHWETWRELSHEQHFRCNHLNLEEVGHVHLWRQHTVWVEFTPLCWKLETGHKLGAIDDKSGLLGASGDWVFRYPTWRWQKAELYFAITTGIPYSFYQFRLIQIYIHMNI